MRPVSVICHVVALARLGERWTPEQSRAEQMRPERLDGIMDGVLGWERPGLRPFWAWTRLHAAGAGPGPDGK